MGFFDKLGKAAEEMGELAQRKRAEVEHYKARLEGLSDIELAQRYKTSKSSAERHAIGELLQERGAI